MGGGGGGGHGEGRRGGGERWRKGGGAMEKYRLLWSLPPPLRRHRAPLLHLSLPRPSPTTTALGGGGGGGGTTASVGGSPSPPPPPPPPRPFSATPAGFAPQASQCPQRPGSEPGYQSQAEEIRLAIFWFRMCSVIGVTEKKIVFVDDIIYQWLQ